MVLSGRDGIRMKGDELREGRRSLRWLLINLHPAAAHTVLYMKRGGHPRKTIIERDRWMKGHKLYFLIQTFFCFVFITFAFIPSLAYAKKQHGETLPLAIALIMLIGIVHLVPLGFAIRKYLGVRKLAAPLRKGLCPNCGIKLELAEGKCGSCKKEVPFTYRAEQEKSKRAIISVVMGIISIIISFTIFLGFPFAWIAMALGYSSLYGIGRDPMVLKYEGMAITGVALGSAQPFCLIVFIMFT